MFNATRGFLLLLLVGLSPNPAWAATKTATFLVQAQIVADCTVAATNLDFGTIGLLSANTDAATTLTVTCSNTSTYNVGLNAGTGTGSTIPNRLLANGAATLQYQLYLTSARNTVWGNTVSTDTQGGTGNGQAQTLTVYGRVPIQAITPAPGTYTSTITATITF